MGSLASREDFDAVVIGGGPAGSVMAWLLAKQGARVAVLERARFPREKVCGDFVEPGGLAILDQLGVLEQIAARERLPIDQTRVYFGPRLAYQGAIPYYPKAPAAFPYGLIVPRAELDALLLDAAAGAGARILSPVEARTFHREENLTRIEAKAGDATVTLRARLLIGADGAQSRVARFAGLARTERRHIGVARRVYLEDIDVEHGEAAIWIDPEFAPGYGWMFPMPGGRANVGVGLCSYISDGFGIGVRATFEQAIERLRLRHPGCARARIASRPLGGVVKTYAGIDRNHFDGGLLIGDAGSFVDPVTGEGMTHGMELAVLALPSTIEALERGRFAASDLERYEADFRSYFDPSMTYLALAAALLTNRYLAGVWLRIIERGYATAQTDPLFGQLGGAIFGGPLLEPAAATLQIWTRVLQSAAEALAGAGGDVTAPSLTIAEDAMALRQGWEQSRRQDPAAHAEWLGEVGRRALAAHATIWTRPNPRPAGVFRHVGLEAASPGEPTDAHPLGSAAVRALVARGARALVEAGFALASRPSTPALTDLEPRRRWRVKA